MAPKHIPYLFFAFLLFSIHSFVAQSKDLQSPKKSGFKYLENLEGVQKGLTAKGVNEVKQFLQRFGYYSTTSSDTTLMTDDFDDLLESALKMYQKTFHLNVTGTITSDTIKIMMMPRCGMPDIINTPTSKPLEYNHKSNKFHMVAHYSYPQPERKWSKNDLTYSFGETVQAVNLKTLRDVCSRAFQKWANVTQFTFKESRFNNISIGFYRGYHGDGYPFYGPGEVTAHAFFPQDGRLHYDADENWSTSTKPSRSQIDLESITVHELGHILGLGHSKDQNAVMYPTFNYGQVKRNLTEDDIKGIQALYGKN